MRYVSDVVEPKDGNHGLGITLEVRDTRDKDFSWTGLAVDCEGVAGCSVGYDGSCLVIPFSQRQAKLLDHVAIHQCPRHYLLDRTKFIVIGAGRRKYELVDGVLPLDFGSFTFSCTNYIVSGYPRNPYKALSLYDFIKDLAFLYGSFVFECKSIIIASGYVRNFHEIILDKSSPEGKSYFSKLALELL